MAGPGFTPRPPPSQQAKGGTQQASTPAFTPKPKPSSQRQEAINEPIVGDNLAALADYYQAVLPEFSPQELRDQFEKMDLVTPERRMAAAQGAEAAVSKIDQFYSGAGQVLGLLRMRAEKSPPEKWEENQNRLTAFSKALEDHRAGRSGGTLKRIGREAGAGTKATMELLDTPFRAVRNLTVGEDPKTKETVTPEKWNDAIKKSDSLPVQAFRRATDLAGLPLAALTAPLAVGARVGGRALSDLGQFLSPGTKDAGNGLKGFEGEAKDAWDTVKKVAEDTGDSTRNIVSDPLSWVSLGGAGEGEAVLKQSARFLRAAGVFGPQADVALQEVRAAMKAADPGKLVADLQRGKELVRSDVMNVEGILSKTLGKPVNPANGTPFGIKGELFGKSGPALTTPVGGRLELADVASKVGLHRVARDLAHPLADAAVGLSKVSNAFGGRALSSVDPIRQAAGANVVQHMASRKELGAKYDADKMKLAETARDAGLNRPSEWEELANKTLDPNYVTMTQREAADKIGMSASDFEQKGRFFHVNGDAEKRLLVADPTHVPESALSPEKQRFISHWSQMRHSRLQDLKDAGLEVSNAPNPVSGHNVPRKYESVSQLLEETAPVRQGEGGATMMKHRKETETLGVSRVGGLPLGAKEETKLGMKADRNLLTLQTGYDDAASRVIARAKLMDKLGLEGIAVPAEKADSRKMVTMGKWAVRPDIAKLIDASLDPAGRSLASQVRAWGTPAGRILGAGLDAGTALANQWKKNGLILRPGYHVVNALNDMVYMHSLGVNNPAWRLKEVDRAIRAIADGRPTNMLLKLKDGSTMPWEDVIRLARENNIGMGFLDRAGLSGTKTAKELERVTKDKSPRGVDLTGRIGDASERLGSYARIGSFAERLKNLDSAPTAAKLVANAHVDYEVGGAATRFGGKVFPFIKFMSRSPKSLAQAAVMRPGSINVVPHIAEGFQGEQKKGVEPRNYIFERGPGYRIPSYMEGPFSSLREFAGGTRLGKDENAYTLSRDPYVEPAMQLVEPLTLNGPAAANMLWPHLRAPVELMAEKDMLTRKPMRLEAGLNPNTPWWGGGAVGAIGGAQLGGWKGALAGGLIGSALAAGNWAEASPGAQGALSRYGAQAMAPGVALLPLNWAIRNTQGERMGQASTLGAMRDRDSRSALPGDALAGQFGSQMTGFPTYVESPMGGLWNMTNSPGMKRNQDMLAEIQKLILGLKQAHLLQRQ